MIKIDHVAYVSLRLNETDSVILFPRLNPRTAGGGWISTPSQVFRR